MLFSGKDDRIEKYKRIRSVAQQLTGRLQKRLPKFALLRAAKDLGLMGPRGILTFRKEENVSTGIETFRLQCLFFQTIQANKQGSVFLNRRY